jgi:hypothetical protein
MMTEQIADAVWNPMTTWIGAKTGLWRVNAWAWNREARQLEELAAEVAEADDSLADSAERLRARARNLRRWAQEAKP